MAAARRYHAVFLSDERTRGLRPNSVFFYVQDQGDATLEDTDALAVANAIGGLINAKLGSLLRQTFKIDDADLGTLPEGFDVDGPGGKANSVKVLFKNPTHGSMEQLRWYYGDAAKGADDIKTVFDGIADKLVNRYGDPLGDIIDLKLTPIKPE